MYDESIDITNAEEVRSPTPKSSASCDDREKVRPALKKSTTLKNASLKKHYSQASFPTEKESVSMHGGSRDFETRGPGPRLEVKTGEPFPADHRQNDEDEEDENDDEDDEEDDDDDVEAPKIEGMYDPQEFENLPVPPDLKEIFSYITKYTPQTIALDYKLQPFIPDYIPAVGDIDAFLKVARPDGKPDQMGLVVLDEPCANQSESAVLQLQLQATLKQASALPTVVKKIEDPTKNPRIIERWIKDMSDLHKTRPAPTVHYSKPMPDIDSLMQEWPSEFEQKLNQLGLPLTELECDLPTLIDVICEKYAKNS